MIINCVYATNAMKQHQIKKPKQKPLLKLPILVEKSFRKNKYRALEAPLKLGESHTPYWLVEEGDRVSAMHIQAYYPQKKESIM